MQTSITLMDDTIRTVLRIIDGTHDGVLTFDVLRKNGIRFTDEVNAAIQQMIKTGVLVKRDTYDFSAERPDNTKSVWGEQKGFNRYVHLKSDEAKKICENDNYHGLRMVIMNDIGSCINSIDIKTEEEGKQYFRKYYDNTYSFYFVVV